MCWQFIPAAAKTLAAAVGAGAAVKSIEDSNDLKKIKPPQPPQAPQAPKAPDQVGARASNRDAAVRAGIASTYKTPLGGVPMGQLNLGSNALLGG